MRALRLANASLSLADVPRPEPVAGEAVVRVRLAGICATDLALLRGYLPFTGVIGHEFVGEVTSAPDAPGLVGARVAADINVGCGRADCPHCAKGDPRHCPGRTALGLRGRDGAFAEYIRVPLANLHRVPDTVPDAAAVFAEPLAAALEIPRQITLTGKTRLLVLGDGRLGLLTALALRSSVPGLVLAGRHARKLAIARNAGIDTVAVDGTDAGVRELRASGRAPFDVVVEATGSPAGLNQALGLVRPEGIVVAKTTIPEPTSIDLARLVVNEVTLMGSRCGDVGFALDQLTAGTVNPTPLIEGVHALEDYQEAFKRAASGGLKVLLRP